MNWREENIQSSWLPITVGLDRAFCAKTSNESTDVTNSLNYAIFYRGKSRNNTRDCYILYLRSYVLDYMWDKTG